MSVPQESVPLTRLNLLYESALKILGRHTVAFYMRARVRMRAYAQSPSHRPNFKINKKIETFMWDTWAWDALGTGTKVMEASHG